MIDDAEHADILPIINRDIYLYDDYNDQWRGTHVRYNDHRHGCITDRQEASCSRVCRRRASDLVEL